MDQRVIGIFLNDEDFTKKMAGYWGKRLPQFIFRTYTRPDILCKDAESGPLYMLVCDEKTYKLLREFPDAEKLSADTVGKVVAFTEDGQPLDNWGERSCTSIYRYQSMDELLAEALKTRESEDEGREFISEEEEETLGRLRMDPVEQLLDSGLEKEADMKDDSHKNQLKDMKIIGVYSPVGRCGKSRFALTLSRELARYGSTVSLNFEMFSDSYVGLTENEPDISDFIFALLEGRLAEEFARFGNMTPETVVCEPSAFDDPMLQEVFPCEPVYINAASNPEDVLLVDSDMLTDVLRYSRAAGFTTAVLDIGSTHLNPLEFLEVCDVIYSPVTDSECSRRKWEHFRRYVDEKCESEIANKITTLILPDAGEEFDDMGMPVIPEGFKDFVRGLVCRN